MTDAWYATIKSSPGYPTDEEFIAMMERADLWPAHRWLMRDRTALAVKNDRTGELGVIFNVSYLDRHTVYGVNCIDSDAMRRVAVDADTTGITTWTYDDFTTMLTAGWRPD